MTTHTYPATNWLAQLSALLEQVEDDDTIIAHSEVAAELIRRAMRRMRPELRIQIIIQGEKNS